VSPGFGSVAQSAANRHVLWPGTASASWVILRGSRKQNATSTPEAPLGHLTSPSA
jgi:hypothetical protein